MRYVEIIFLQSHVGVHFSSLILYIFCGIREAKNGMLLVFQEPKAFLTVAAETHWKKAVVGAAALWLLGWRNPCRRGSTKPFTGESGETLPKLNVPGSQPWRRRRDCSKEEC